MSTKKELKDYVFDADRKARTGIDEVVFCLPKSVEQISQAVRYAQDNVEQMLFTRLELAKYQALSEDLSSVLDYDALSQTAIYGKQVLVEETNTTKPQIGIVTAGTSDLAVAHEAKRTLHYYEKTSDLYSDIGVAGLWRLLEKKDTLASYPILIVLAGMEGAIFSVLSGLVANVIIAVPTSTGYGVAAGGRTALESALGGCSPGVVTVNIDNGFGAACAALRMLNVLNAQP